MKDVFRRLVSFLGLDKPSETPSVDWESLGERDHYIRSDLEVRTKVIYPQNRQNQGSSHFRFPIIADEKPPEKTSRVEPVQQQKRENQIEREPIRVENKIEPLRKTNRNKPFRPSEVVSPVYGRVDPRNRSFENKEMQDSTNCLEKFNPDHSVTISNNNEVKTLDSNTTRNDHVQNVQRSIGELINQHEDNASWSLVLSRANIEDQGSIETKHSDDVVRFHSSSAEEEFKPSVLTDFISKHNQQVVQLKDEPTASSDESMHSQLEQPPVEVGKQRTQSNVIAFPTVLNDRVKFKESSPSIEEMEKDDVDVPAPPNRNVIEAERLAHYEVPGDKYKVMNTQQYTIADNKQSQESHNYLFPYLRYLKEEPLHTHDDDFYTDQQIEKLVVALENFSVKADVIGVVKGPTVTRYELQPAPGVKVNKFTNLIDDIKLALAAKDIRMEAPIPGRSAIGIEVPNEVSLPVFIRSILASEEFQQNSSPLSVALGRDISGAPVIGDLKKMPHGLIAGSTGSGKSVCVNSIIISLLYKAKPEDVRLILIDPKVVELAPYNHIPHLLTPVVTDPKQATAALKWAVEEMDGRYEKFADTGARDIERYNLISMREGKEKLPYIVIIIDELADLMMVAPGDVEESICRIAQKARACGIHLLVATQRPSVDVITGLIKANIPTRIAFAVSSMADSRTILDMGGAERLLGKGDMLYYPSGTAKPIRLQGNFVSDDEIEHVIDHVKAQQKTVYLFDKEELTRATSSAVENDDELFEEALLFVVEQGQASSSSLQRRFRIGYNRAARLVDMMESEGFITAQSGSKPRDVLLSLDEYHNLFG